MGLAGSGHARWSGGRWRRALAASWEARRGMGWRAWARAWQAFAMGHGPTGGGLWRRALAASWWARRGWRARALAWQACRRGRALADLALVCLAGGRGWRARARAWQAEVEGGGLWRRAGRRWLWLRAGRLGAGAPGLVGLAGGWSTWACAWQGFAMCHGPTGGGRGRRALGGATLTVEVMSWRARDGAAYQI